jgi:hypothetical protein
LNNKWHDVFVDVKTPGIFESEIGLDVVIACVEGSCEELLLFAFYEELEQLLNYFSIICLLSCFDSVSVDLIFFGEVDALFKFTIFTVEIGSNTSELQQMMAFSSFGHVV